MRRTDVELGAEALEHLRVLRHHASNGIDSDTIVDAVCLRLSAAIETLSRTSEEFRTSLVGEDWPLLWATRNRIAHGYADIDPDMIRATVDRDLPALEHRLRDVVQDR